MEKSCIQCPNLMEDVNAISVGYKCAMDVLSVSFPATFSHFIAFGGVQTYTKKQIKLSFIKTVSIQLLLIHQWLDFYFPLKQGCWELDEYLAAQLHMIPMESDV